MGFFSNIASSGGGSGAVTSSVSGTSGSLTLNPSSYNVSFVSFVGTFSSNTRQSFILQFNSDSTTAHYTADVLLEVDVSGPTNLSVSGGLPLTFTGGAASGSAANSPISVTIMLTTSGGNTVWEVAAQYTSGSEGTAFGISNGTFAGNVTTVNISSNHTLTGTLSGIKVS